MKDITISTATDVDPSELATLRVAAMRPSLEAMGRFDPDRARMRFLATYDAQDTQVLRAGSELIGFYVLRKRPDHLYLDHLYIQASHQGGGLGRAIVQSVQDQARRSALPLRLMALRGSPANDFYLSCGFHLERSDDLDNHYVWRHGPVPAQDA